MCHDYCIYMKKYAAKKFSFFVVIFFLTQFGSAQKKINFTSELQRIANISLLPEYMEGTIVKQVSSYDTTGGNNDGFSGMYSFLRKEPDGGLVIFDEKGQGVIERIWTPTPTDDILDFYFEGSTAPALSIRFRDLFNNTTAPFLKPLADHKVGGFYSYVPIPYKNGCKIVFRGEKILFHQIQFRSYDKRYLVESFSKQQIAPNLKLIKNIVSQWHNPLRSIESFQKDAFRTIESHLELKPGSTAVLASINHPGRILGFELIPSEILNGLHKQIDLKISWDNESLPAVYLPAADFFGFAFGSRSMESLLLGTTSSKAYCYIPMPFDKNAKIELVYRKNGPGEKAVSVTSKVYYSTNTRITGKEGRFYAFWRKEQPPLGKPFAFLEGNGRGHYIGTLMQGQATDYTHFTEFFEGDDYTAIDGSMTIHGTGSEDYFNGGWYAQPGGWVERLGAPISGCLDYSLPLGRTGGYRLFISDKMPFNKSIVHTIEHGPEKNNRLVDYTSVALYYADKPVETQRPPTNEKSTVYIPETVTFYTRLMRHLTYNGNLQFRNDAATLLGSDNAVLNINVSEVPNGKYKILLHQVKSETDNLEVRIADARKVQDWKAIEVTKGGQHLDLFIGDVEVADSNIPVSILFRSKTADPGLVFDRVALRRID